MVLKAELLPVENAAGVKDGLESGALRLGMHGRVLERDQDGVITRFKLNSVGVFKR